MKYLISTIIIVLLGIYLFGRSVELGWSLLAGLVMLVYIFKIAFILRKQ